MKKGYFSVIISLVLVFCISIACTYLFSFDKTKKPFTTTTCLTDSITETMTCAEIATMYKKGTVAVYVESKYTSGYNIMSQTSLGSGVCVASIGYSTQDGNYTVNKGSYFVTNYHVVNVACDDDYDNYENTISIIIDDGNYTSYNAEILWASEQLDMALLFCDEQIDGLQWIAMKDRWINPKESEQLGYDEVFTLGSPLNLQYINTFSLGYVSNTYSKKSASVKDFYYWNDGGQVVGTSNSSKVTSPFGIGQTEVLENLYEDLIMINLDITHGNSGGGLFDSDGYLIGLTTLGLTYEDTNGAQMNFAVPIFPMIQILDKIIVENECNIQELVYDYQSLGLNVADSSMSRMALSVQEQTSVSFYYVDRIVLQTEDKSLLEFEDDGCVVLSNTSTGLFSNIAKGSVLIGADFGDSNQRIDINDRNDLIYFLLQCDKGDTVHFYYLENSSATKEKSIYVEL